MLALLAILALLVIVMTVPIMIGARIVKAENAEFGRAFLVAIVLAVLNGAVGKVIDNGLVQFVVVAATGGLMISAFMGTTYKRGIAIALIAAALQALLVLVLAGAAVTAAG